MSILDRIIGKKEKEAEKSGKVVAAKKEKTSVANAGKKAPEKEGKRPAGKASKKSTTAKAQKDTAKRKITKQEANIAYKILFENLISEKSTLLAAQNKYLFRVDKRAGKFQIKEAIEGYYGVQVIGVNTIRISPKKRIHGRTIGWKKGFKKAVVTLREGDTIAATEGV